MLGIFFKILNYFIQIYSSIPNVPFYSFCSYCSYCKKPFVRKLWCKKCDPFRLIERVASGNSNIDKFIKDTIYCARNDDCPELPEWIPFDRFININLIGEGGFAKVYSAIWNDGEAKYFKLDDGNWKRREPEPIKVALKRLNDSQNMTSEYLNELIIHWHFCERYGGLQFYGMTKDPETEEYMMVVQFAEGNLRNFLSNNFNNLLWKDKIRYLQGMAVDLKYLHKLGYCHQDLHSGNILQIFDQSYISDFGLSRPSDKQKLNNKLCGVLPYIAPEVLNGSTYTSASDIYSFGVIMTELSSGKPPFYDKKHDLSLLLAICNKLRPEFGIGTPEIYKNLACKCMNAEPNQRPTASELNDILEFWSFSFNMSEDSQEKENFGYKGKEITATFEEADKEIPNISTSYKKDPDAIYTSRVFCFTNLNNISNEENYKGSVFNF
ncbi:Mkk2p [Rhizophagus irregularis DAOM 197198w]|uniref:Mkk2p n=2 Tax=Rhizophagus irregularis TaxID=588596 RepID=A0A015JVM5_RHIIW|nr:Mkk2p [Rhizophagus irregularis DAOM 197198w]